MSTRLLFCLALLGCGGNKKTDTLPEAAPAAAEPAPAPPIAPAEPAASKRLEPPQRWEQHGKRGNEIVMMGYVAWSGGEAFEVQLMGTMKIMLENEIKDAIQAKPDDPGGAIQDVIDQTNAFLKESNMPIEWVHTSRAERLQK
jgi:hypothetical protein